MTMTVLLYSIPGVRFVHTKLNQLSSYIPPPPPEKLSPRRILLVHSQAFPESILTACIADAFEKSAIDAGHSVKHISLCDQGSPLHLYRPSLSRAERESYDSNSKVLSNEVMTHLELVKWCDTLVFVYPTWWMNTPASLKGFFDRTLVYGLTWELPSSSPAGAASLGLVPKLNNIERIVGISTYYFASRANVTVAGDNGRRMISNAIRHSVCPYATVQWLGLYGVETLSIEQWGRFLEEVAQLPKEL